MAAVIKSEYGRFKINVFENIKILFLNLNKYTISYQFA